MTAPALDPARLSEIRTRPCPWPTTAGDIGLLLGEVDRLSTLADRLTLALADTAERRTMAERENAALLRHNEAVARKLMVAMDEADALRRRLARRGEAELVCEAATELRKCDIEARGCAGDVPMPLARFLEAHDAWLTAARPERSRPMPERETSPDEVDRRKLLAEANAAGNKFRYMTKAEEEAIFFGHERDLIHKDWLEAEKVVNAARDLFDKAEPDVYDLLYEALAAYDAYLASEKAKAAEPSGLPSRGLVSTGKSVKGSVRAGT